MKCCSNCLSPKVLCKELCSACYHSTPESRARKAKYLSTRAGRAALLRTKGRLRARTWIEAIVRFASVIPSTEPADIQPIWRRRPAEKCVDCQGSGATLTGKLCRCLLPCPNCRQDLPRYAHGKCRYCSTRLPEEKRQDIRDRRFGLPKGSVRKMFEQQAGRCAICLVDMTEGGRGSRSVNVDHCHKTGRVRGLLCSGCNRGLGMFGDTAEGLIRAAEYLVRFEEQSGS